MKAAKKMFKTDYVEGARMMADLQKDGEALATYGAFKGMDGMLDRIAKMYLGAKSVDEAVLCRQALVDYKAGMVDVLGKADDASRAKAMEALGARMEDFWKRYMAMQPEVQPNR